MNNENLDANTHWISVFKDMFLSGEVAKMGPQAFAIYVAIKTHINSTGLAFPSLDIIAGHTGICYRQVKNELKTLEELGYVVKDKIGRNNFYKLREKVFILNREGPFAIASWDYIPPSLPSAIEELRNMVIAGNFNGAKIISIRYLQMNNSSHNEAVVNIQRVEGKGDVESKIAGLKRALKGQKEDDD